MIRYIVVIGALLMLLWAWTSEAQEPTCSEQTALTTEYANTLREQRDRLMIDLAQTRVQYSKVSGELARLKISLEEKVKEEEAKKKGK